MIEVDGHDIGALQKAFAEAAAMKEQPTVIIAHTMKGKGVSFMENNPKFHGTAPTAEKKSESGALIGARIMPAKTKFELKPGWPLAKPSARRSWNWAGESRTSWCWMAIFRSPLTQPNSAKFPDRFFECGIAEANMMGIGSGLASAGKIPFASSFSVFLLNKGFEQLRVTAAFPNVNEIVGTHSGISIGEDGPSQMSIEDLSLACSLPGFTVMSPADEVATMKLVQAPRRSCSGPCLFAPGA